MGHRGTSSTLIPGLRYKVFNDLKTVDDNGVDFGEAVPDLDICAVGKNHQLVHPMTADNNVQRASQSVMTDLMEPIMPEALGGVKYACKIFDEYTK